MPGITERRQGGDVGLGEGLVVLQRLERGQGSAVSSWAGAGWACALEDGGLVQRAWANRMT